MLVVEWESTIKDVNNRIQELDKENISIIYNLKYYRTEI